MSLIDICTALENTAIGVWVRESLYGFPIVVAFHIVGLTLSVGVLVWFDLRLAGMSMPRCRVSELYRRLMPLMFTGFAVMLVSGVILFAAYATKAYENVYFRIKLTAMLAAAINAIYFHMRTERRIARWDADVRPPFAARFAGVLSIVAWTIVIMAGRFMSYTMF